MNRPTLLIGCACSLLLASAAVTRLGADGPDTQGWSPKAAAAYLDGRAAWWTTYPNASRDHGTFCVSCHTTLPYALARPTLRQALGEKEPSPVEMRVLDTVATRVKLWNETSPYYPDQLRGLPKTSESRGTEAILNALLLANRDAAGGRLTPETRAAFDHLWALQMKTQDLSGAWAWLNFHYEPWESPNAPYFGASLAAIAIGTAPEAYAATPGIQQNLTLLRGYFQREFERQPLFNRLMVLWASSKLSKILSPEQQRSIVEAAAAAQRADGGWSTASLGSWSRGDDTPLETDSDGYGTGLAILALEASGVARSDRRVSRGLDWLRHHQDPATGRWSASSLNKRRDPESDAGRFMSDAATALAVLALTHPLPAGPATQP